ncbi:hypothetical protein C8R43DRAFT_902582 [Mycena crocata]|nr:hypothetical protein C8R43DRAFT_902582 [Mycena crocata]
MPPPPASVTVVVPSNAPEWLHEIVPWLLAQDLSCHFTALVGSLVQLETAFEFDDGNGACIPREHRPAELDKWIKQGRISKNRNIPEVTTKGAPKFATAFSRWWDALQPKWRTRRRDGQWAFGGDVEYGPADAWGQLDVPGINGCLTAVAGLYMWGLCKGQSADLKLRWSDAVLDVTWMLEGLALSMQ